MCYRINSRKWEELIRYIKLILPFLIFLNQIKFFSSVSESCIYIRRTDKDANKLSVQKLPKNGRRENSRDIYMMISINIL